MPSGNELVSVIMPAFNAEHFIKDAVQSILNQSYQNLELLIGIDGATDRTLEIVQTFKDDRIKIYSRVKNMGNVYTCNELFSKCSGEFIAIQDADDWSHVDRIKRQIDFFHVNPSVGLVGTGSYRVDGEKNIIEILNYPSDDFQIRSHFHQGAEPCFVCASVMVKMEVLQKVGGYREFYSGIGAADYDWIYRISEITSLANIETPLYYNRRHPNSLTKSFNKNPLRNFSPQIAHYCYQQRLKGEKDLISAGGKKLNDYLTSLQEGYSKNPSLIYFEYAQYLYSLKRYWPASRFAVSGIIRNPLLLSNYMHLLHYIRMAVFS